MLQSSPSCYSIESSNPLAAYRLSSELLALIDAHSCSFKSIALLCIGTDRSTGDCLGPLVGYKLNKSIRSDIVKVFGTLNNPVHAKNLSESVDFINSTMKSPIIIAIDASLGKAENIGKINLHNGPLCPGAGVNKNLPLVGNISITGIVNISGYMEYVVLQNTRLSVVMEMANVISLSIYMSVRKLEALSSIS